MLQQTTVATVIPYFNRFLARFPTIDALAKAPINDVMEAWAGLGYYARARNLHACAKRLAQIRAFPKDLAGLRALPGVGAYTAAAIASIAFGIPVIPIDGNVERVVARLFAIATPLPAGKSAIAAAAAALGDQPAAKARAADFTQALFDLGATICTPRAPACTICPWRECCHGSASGDPERLPVKSVKKARPIRYGAHFWLEDSQGNVLLRRRPPEGLLGGMLELPGTAWREAAWCTQEAIAAAPQRAGWRHVGVAHHGFTHFQLVLDVYRATAVSIRADGMVFPVSSLAGAALPTVMNRCVALVLARKKR
jgi:A/G-specific adenine glycosylase